MINFAICVIIVFVVGLVLNFYVWSDVVNVCEVATPPAKYVPPSTLCKRMANACCSTTVIPCPVCPPTNGSSTNSSVPKALYAPAGILSKSRLL
jgi:hypothetical protein